MEEQKLSINPASVLPLHEAIRPEVIPDHVEVFLRHNVRKCTCTSKLVWKEIVDNGGSLCFQCSDGVVNIEPCLAKAISSYVKMVLPRLTQEGSEKGIVKQLSGYRCDSVALFFRVRSLGVVDALLWLQAKVGSSPNCMYTYQDDRCVCDYQDGKCVCELECMHILEEMCPGDSAARQQSLLIANGLTLRETKVETVAMAVCSAWALECEGLMRVCYAHVNETKGLEDAFDEHVKGIFECIRTRLQPVIAEEDVKTKRTKRE